MAKDKKPAFEPVKKKFKHADRQFGEKHVYNTSAELLKRVVLYFEEEEQPASESFQCQDMIKATK